ncbi:hypothetical protein F5Y16DRAFT_39672 [Xylariaceae sp. FL0255]|nr:hypothetical protein F5Y16DRAFT_39672 [Xylariaceae sp. FL0255]
MAPASGSVFSATLQEITNTKLEELSKRRSEFETEKVKILSQLQNESVPLERLRILCDGVKKCYSMTTTKDGQIVPGNSSNSDLHFELNHLANFVKQAEYDPSVSATLVKTWEDSLMNHLNTQSSKFQYASLYAQLVTEWLSSENATDSSQEDVSMTEGFENVSDSMRKESREQWEKLVFEPANVNETELKAYLSHLFDLRVSSQTEKTPITKALNQLRASVTNFENSMASPNQFNAVSLKWTIDGLLASDLLTEEKREVLRDFQRNTVILAEVADVLNMRMSAFSTWSWGDSVSLEQRRKITGVYNVLMHEDVLQAIFLHYVGVKWSVFLKRAFTQFRKTQDAWKFAEAPISQLDRKRREYYLGSYDSYTSLRSARNRVYTRHYFMEGLMDFESQQSLSNEGEEEAEYATEQDFQVQQYQAPQQLHRVSANVSAGYHAMVQAPVQGRMKQTARKRMAAPQAPAPAGMMMGRMQTYENEEDESDFHDDEPPKERNSMEDKQRLIRLLSTEIAINTKLHGEITAIHAAFESWNSLLPHETILIIMKLFGVSQTWMDFFTKFLKAPLKFLDDAAEKPPRTRCRGTPASHALSEVFGESILFCLDFAVNRATGGRYLHRMHDDFFFWSPDHEVVKTAWKAVEAFTNATRTYIQFPKSGTVRISHDPNLELEIDENLPRGDIRWGFLRLSTSTGKFEIDQAIVDKHIIDLRRQLVDKRRSVISLIQTWNTFAATFFTSNFGKAAHCFGRAHVDQMLATHRRIQAEVFAESASMASLLAGDVKPEEPITNVVDYIKHLLRSRFDVSERIPDAYLFFPVELGGLDLRSPFVSILPVREAVLSDPNKELDKFLEAERDEYGRKKTDFETGIVHRVMHDNFKPEDPDKFMSLEEFTRYREDLGSGLVNNLAVVFGRLLDVPNESSSPGGIHRPSPRLESALKALALNSSSTALSHGALNQNMLRGIHNEWGGMQPYWRWVAQLYGPEAIDRFGGLRIVEPGLLPMGMVGIFREKRVTWGS